jgi:crossover junction endodeoxyribonuclease RuvC
LRQVREGPAVTAPILACDPGLAGAFALWEPERDALKVTAMPVLKRELADGKLKTVLDEPEVVALLAVFAGVGARDFFLEEVMGAPGQSGPAMFNFGYGVGVVYAAALAAGLTVHRVPSSVWKPAMKAPKDKKAARHRAGELLPRQRHLWPLAGDDGKAEAAMLALYGARKLGRG